MERRRQDAAVLRQEGAVDTVEARPELVGRPVEIRQGIHLVPGALHQFLQAFSVGHVCADQDHVERGQLIGDIPEGKLSSKVFASISGRISAADSEKITIES